jgi:DNA-binding NarL/FixJ family response regulator
MSSTAENLDASFSDEKQRYEAEILSSLRNPNTIQEIDDADSMRNESFINICVVDKCPFTRECISNYLGLLGKNFKVRAFPNIRDSTTTLAIHSDLVIYHLHAQSEPEETIASLKPIFESFPVIILSDLDGTEWMLEALQSGARGYIPTGSTSVAIAVEAIRLVKAGGVFVPNGLLMMQRPTSPPRLRLEEPLSARQTAVLQHLTIGKSNKVIAYELGMSESTVKVHVRNIMKKMHATNRTEVAYRAQSLWSAEQSRLVARDQVRERSWVVAE